MNGYKNVLICPALRPSIDVFLKYWFYFFTNQKTSWFKKEVYEKAVFAWLWNDFDLYFQWEKRDKKYIEINYIWKIIEQWNIVIEIEKDKITKISFDFWDEKKNQEITSSEDICKAFREFMENTYFVKDDYNFLESTPKKWHFIKVNKEEIIDYEEKMLFPQKEVVAIDLHTDESWKIIKNEKFVDLIRISDNLFLDENNWRIFISSENSFIKIWDANSKDYVDIVKNFIIKESIDIKKWKNYADLGNLELNFNKAKFAKFLPYKIKIDTKKMTIEKIAKF